MNSYTAAAIQAAWEKGTPVRGKSPAAWRKDEQDRLIRRSAYGKEGKSGWKIISTAADDGGNAGLSALYPLHWQGKTPLDIIREIIEMSAADACIFRGENMRYKKPVSSGLYRELCLEGGKDKMESRHFSTHNEEESIVEGARQYMLSNNLRNIEVITMLQHHGCPTAHIDFSYSMLIALFNACYGHPKKNGYVYIFPLSYPFILLDDIKYDEQEQKQAILIKSSFQEPRARFQSSVFVRAHKGFLDLKKGKKVIVPWRLKQAILKLLREKFAISEQTVYLDVHGFINNRRNSLEARRYMHKGLEHYEKGHYREAIAYYNKADKLQPRMAALYYNRGCAWQAQEAYDKAITDYDLAISIDMNMVKAYVNRGIVRHLKKDFDGAIADYDIAISKNRELPLAYFGRGNARHFKGDLDGAIVDYDTAISKNRELSLAYANRGIAKHKKGDLNGARKDFQSALDLATRQRKKKLSGLIKKRLSAWNKGK